jgi:hypothetical protein
MTEPERKIHNKNEDTNSKQATSNNRLLVINNWGTTHQPTKTSMTVTSTPKIKDDSFFDDYSVIPQYQAEKQLINEETKVKVDKMNPATGQEGGLGQGKKITQ